MSYFKQVFTYNVQIKYPQCALNNEIFIVKSIVKSTILFAPQNRVDVCVAWLHSVWIFKIQLYLPLCYPHDRIVDRALTYLLQSYLNHCLNFEYYPRWRRNRLKFDIIPLWAHLTGRLHKVVGPNQLNNIFIVLCKSKRWLRYKV